MDFEFSQWAPSGSGLHMAFAEFYDPAFSTLSASNQQGSLMVKEPKSDTDSDHEVELKLIDQSDSSNGKILPGGESCYYFPDDSVPVDQHGFRSTQISTPSRGSPLPTSASSSPKSLSPSHTPSSSSSPKSSTDYFRTRRDSFRGQNEEEPSDRDPGRPSEIFSARRLDDSNMPAYQKNHSQELPPPRPSISNRVRIKIFVFLFFVFLFFI